VTALPSAPRAQLSPVELERFVAALARGPQPWREILDMHGGSARSYAEIWSDDYVNAWAIRWTAGADTGFHDHDVAATGIAVLEGSVIEERLALAGPPLARRFASGQTFHLPAAAIHRVLHGGGPEALTVHAYSPPLRVQGAYRVTPDGALERDVVPYTEELGGKLASQAA
jgi:hypothetical protein